eukprot:scaffold2644_cov63-Phaeocystis_antarctica.AAC.8
MLRFLIPKPAPAQASPEPQVTEPSMAAPEPAGADGPSQQRVLPKRAREPSDAADATVDSRHTATRVHPSASESVQVLPMTVDSPLSSGGSGGAVLGAAASVESGDDNADDDDDEDDEEMTRAILAAQSQARISASAAAPPNLASGSASSQSTNDDATAAPPVATAGPSSLSADDGAAAAPEQAAPSAPAPSAAALAAVAAAGGQSLSEYEQQRLLNIARNQEVLASLGLADEQPLCVPRGARAGGGRRRARPPAPPPAPSSRSLRSRAPAPSASGDSEQTQQRPEARAKWDDDDDDEPAHAYDTSDVVRYVCGDSAAKAKWDDDDDAEPGRAMLGWRRAGLEFCAKRTSLNLERVYNMDVLCQGDYRCRPILACGGHAGKVMVLPVCGLLDDEEAPSPLLAWKAHDGWVGSVQFATHAGRGDTVTSSGPTLLLTASNSGDIRVWDVNQAERNRPRAAGELVTLDKTWAMHELEGNVLTGGVPLKKASAGRGAVVLSEVGGAGLKTIRSYLALHEDGVVKTVQWRDQHLFGSAGYSEHIVLVDLREPDKAGGSCMIEHANAGHVDTLRWSPTDENIVLSNGADTSARLHDIRQPKSVLHELRGHTGAALASKNRGMQKSIHQPAFCDGGAAVCIMGDCSDLVSMYSTRTGLALSRGMVDWTQGGLGPKGGTTMVVVPRSDAQAHDALLVAHGPKISPFLPVYV